MAIVSQSFVCLFDVKYPTRNDHYGDSTIHCYNTCADQTGRKWINDFSMPTMLTALLEYKMHGSVYGPVLIPKVVSVRIGCLLDIIFVVDLMA